MLFYSIKEHKAQEECYMRVRICFIPCATIIHRAQEPSLLFMKTGNTRSC